MQIHTSNAIKLCAIAAATLLITACGGGEGDDGKNSTSTFATSTGVKTNGVAGQAVYTTSCSSCHGASIPAGVNYLRTLNAIAANKGGMGSLAGSIKTAQADDIATYLAFGAALPTQTITFTSPGNQALGVAPPVLAATSTSGLAVTIASATPTVCTVTNTALTLMAAGSCTLTATQTGNASLTAATAVSNTFTVAAATAPVLTAQTITFGSPGNQTIGVATPALAANSTSGLAVTLASTTPSVCTVSGTTLTLVTAGTCTVTASQAGSATVAAAATALNTFTVAPAATVGVAASGHTLYTAVCSGCHGAPPATVLTRNILKAANAPNVISSAISTNSTSGTPSVTTNMGFLSANAYTPQQLDDIAAYLATPGF